MKMEQADRDFDDLVPSTVLTGWKHVFIRYSTAEVFLDVVQVCRCSISIPSSPRLSDSDVKAITLLQAGHVSLSPRAHVFLTKDNAIYIRDLKWLREKVQHIRDLGMFTTRTALEKWSAPERQ